MFISYILSVEKQKQMNELFVYYLQTILRKAIESCAKSRQTQLGSKNYCNLILAFLLNFLHHST